MSGPNQIFGDRQLAKAIYLRHMAAMKAILNLGEMKFGGRESNAYKIYKKIVMDEFYVAMSEVFAALEKANLLKKCPCNASIRKGYKRECDHCNGAGWCNSDNLNEKLNEDGPPPDILPL
jgi:hypothetical protein